MRVAGLFAGIGGFESGLQAAGHSTILLCENDPRAVTVLSRRFPDVPIHRDVADLEILPANAEVVTAGFPCQDLSMAGPKAGLDGAKSSVVDHLFRLLADTPVSWVLIENVYFMLHLARGAAMERILRPLEELGFHWAYRVVDSRAFGLPQRRRRVFIVATTVGDPRAVLLVDNAPTPAKETADLAKPVAFYWTEGKTGNGLTNDATPPLKAGSSLGIPSPPAVLLPDGRVVTPPIEVAERLQGFRRRWTCPLRGRDARHRWRLVGNAVSVPVAAWIGRRLGNPAPYKPTKDKPRNAHERWPNAAWNMGDGVTTAPVSEFPIRLRRGRLSAYNTATWPDLSARALRGFVNRANEGNLNYPRGFLDALDTELAKRQLLHSESLSSSVNTKP